MFGFILISLVFSVNFQNTKGKGLCNFAERFHRDDRWGSSCLKPPGYEKQNRTEMPDHFNRTGVSDHITTDQTKTNVVKRTHPKCPTDMIFSNCTNCTGTCMDPNGCVINCTATKTCVCPDGFLLKGNFCVPREECACFVDGVGVIPEGGIYIPPDCSRRYSCSGGRLQNNDTYKCSPSAVCDIRNNQGQCCCSMGYKGDGINCEFSLNDCLDIYNTISNKSGVYKIKPIAWQGDPFNVYCNMSDGGGWTVFQRRVNGSQDFYLNWYDYKNGFGTPHHELWLGNDKLHSLTTQKNNELRVDVVNSLGDFYFTKYASFGVSDESDNYRLSLGSYIGGLGGDHLSHNHGQHFTTKDRDNDRWRDGNCARLYAETPCGPHCYNNAAWWYADGFCSKVHINSPYGSDCFRWFNIPGNCNIKYTEMKIRPTNDFLD